MVNLSAKLTDKIDNFSESILIDDISQLTKGLLQLQHAKYPHLVPMYRTVHRVKPRALSYRAIRWVNPKRMYPGSGLSKEEMENMSAEELSKLIVKLNDYRGESHVIHNRYNQMIDMINMGQLPYHIPYANIKENKWMTLQDHMDRALRLKDGTEEWEESLDRQALDIREILNKKHDIKLDQIDGLWQDAEGNAAAPNFMDLKKGREAKKLLRTTRLMEDGRRLKHEPKIFVRRYIAVPEIERRKGEEIRMPAGGKLRAPRDPKKRQIFEEHGGAAVHLARMDRFPWLNNEDRKGLREQGQLISMPAGRKNPMLLAFDAISNEAVAERREARWTQPDPLGRRGVAQHHGPASLRPGGHSANWPRERLAPGGVGQLERAIRDIFGGRQQPNPAVRRAHTAIERKEVTPEAKMANALFQGGQRNLLEAFDADTAWMDEMAAWDFDPARGDKARKAGGGINDATWMVTNGETGKKMIFKCVRNEQRAEILTTTIDQIFGLNIALKATAFSNIDLDQLSDAVPGGIEDKPRDHINHGAGHLMEFCEPECTEFNKLGGNDQIKLIKNAQFREDWNKTILIDFITGNWDRHGGNFMVTSDGQLKLIDSGFGGRMAGLDAPDHGLFDGRDKKDDETGKILESWDGGRRWLRSLARQHSGLTSDQLVQDGLAVFDEYFDQGKLDQMVSEFKLENAREGHGIESIRAAFERALKANW